MDIFTKNKLAFITISVLIVLNVFTLVTIWYGNRDRHRPPVLPRPPQNEDRVAYFLKNELGLTEDQVQNYRQLRKRHREQMGEINDTMKSLKKELMDQLFSDQVDSEKVNQVIESIGEKQKETERIIFHHFMEMKNLCGGGQQEKLRRLFDEIFRPQRPPGMNGGPPNPHGMNAAPTKPRGMDRRTPEQP